jgi:hypothetical protein
MKKPGEVKVYIPEDVKQKFKAKCEREGVTQTRIVAKAIHKYLSS